MHNGEEAGDLAGWIARHDNVMMTLVLHHAGDRRAARIPAACHQAAIVAIPTQAYCSLAAGNFGAVCIEKKGAARTFTSSVRGAASLKNTGRQSAVSTKLDATIASSAGCCQALQTLCNAFSD